MNRPAVVNRITVILLAMVLVITPGVGWAQDQPGNAPATDVQIAIFPKGQDDGTRFEATVEPGQTATFTAMLVNYGTEPIRLLTYSANVIPSTNGGLKVDTPDKDPIAPATWMNYENIEITLQPGESREHPFTVTVPSDTPPGQYVNAVALETADPIQTIGGSQAFEQYFRKLVSVYVVVPGDVVSDFEIGAPEIAVMRGSAGLLIPIENTGNIRVDLSAKVTLSDSDGKVLFSSESLFSPIYMGQATYLQILIGAAPEPGDYVLDLEVIERNSQVTRETEGLLIAVPEDSEPPEGTLYSITEILIEPNADPIVFANVSMNVATQRESIRSGRVTLSVFHNGDFVEDFVIADNLSINAGSSVAVSQRYLPMTSWESGEYTFSVKLESMDGASTTVLLNLHDVATLEVP